MKTFKDITESKRFKITQNVIDEKTKTALSEVFNEQGQPMIVEAGIMSANKQMSESNYIKMLKKSLKKEMDELLKYAITDLKEIVHMYNNGDYDDVAKDLGQPTKS